MNVSQLHHWKAHSASLYALASGRNDESIFSGGADRVVAEWTNGQEEPNSFAIRVNATIYSLTTLPNEQLLIGTASGGIHVIDLKERKELRHLAFHDKGIFHLNVAPESNRMYAACADGSVTVWNTKDWSLLWHLQITQGKVRRTAINADQSLVAVACGDGRCVLLETADHKIVHEIDAHDDSCNSLAFLPDGRLLTGGKDAHLKCWNPAKNFACEKSIPAHNFAIYDIVVSNDGWIATASRDKTIKIWDQELEEQPIRIDRKGFDGHINSVNGLYLHPVSGLLYSCSDDRSIGVWKIDS